MSLNKLLVIIGLLIGPGLASVGLFRPFLGLIVLLVLHFVQIGELIPPLATFRLELVYGVLLLAAFSLRRTSTLVLSLFSDRILQAAIVLVGVCCLTVPFAIWKLGALNATIELAKLVTLLFFLRCLTDTDDRLRKVVWFLVALLTWYSGSSFVAYLKGDYVFAQGIDRAFGLTSVVGDANALAGMIIALLPFLLVAFRITQRVLPRLILILIFLLALPSLAVTGSRTGSLGLLVLLMYYVARSRRKVANLAASVVLASILWLTLPAQYQNRYLTTLRFAQGSQLDESNQLRIRLWEAGWRMFLDHPILGVGAGQFSTAYGVVYAGHPHVSWMNSHNLLIQVGSEGGVVGLLAFGYFLFQITKINRSILRLKGQSPYQLNYRVAIACEACLVAIFVISVFGHTLYHAYWYLLGGLVGANQHLVFETKKGLVPAVSNTAMGRKPRLVWTRTASSWLERPE